jgi:hypothetical protein
LTITHGSREWIVRSQDGVGYGRTFQQAWGAHMNDRDCPDEIAPSEAYDALWAYPPRVGVA